MPSYSSMYYKALQRNALGSAPKFEHCISAACCSISCIWYSSWTPKACLLSCTALLRCGPRTLKQLHGVMHSVGSKALYPLQRGVRESLLGVFKPAPHVAALP